MKADATFPPNFGCSPEFWGKAVLPPNFLLNLSIDPGFSLSKMQN